MTIRIHPMPSPTGRNQARLFMGVLGRPAAVFAADSARRRQAKDSATSEAMSALQQFLNGALSPGDQGTAESLLTQLLETLPAAQPDDDNSDTDTDADQPAEDRRRKLAGDHRLDGFARMDRLFPDAKLPKQY